LCRHISKQDIKVTDLKPEVNKAGLYEKNHYGLHWALPSRQAESLHNKHTVTPAILVQGEWLDPVNPAYSDAPQFIRNH
jgi:hypothetical protein